MIGISRFTDAYVIPQTGILRKNSPPEHLNPSGNAGNLAKLLHGRGANAQPLQYQSSGDLIPGTSGKLSYPAVLEPPLFQDRSCD